MNNNTLLRDQFAMAALTGLLASECVSNGGCLSEYISYSSESAAARAYAIADAMMRKRAEAEQPIKQEEQQNVAAGFHRIHIPFIGVKKDHDATAFERAQYDQKSVINHTFKKVNRISISELTSSAKPAQSAPTDYDWD